VGEEEEAEDEDGEDGGWLLFSHCMPQVICYKAV
jgi:hypothetical protein